VNLDERPAPLDKLQQLRSLQRQRTELEKLIREKNDTTNSTNDQVNMTQGSD
jgi:hypothetical protein